jgi:thiol-disulfide isomerase/thioredoxin
MKIILSSILILVINLFGYTQNGFVIKANVQGLKDGSFAYLVHRNDKGLPDTVNKAIIRKNRFLFKNRMSIDGECFFIFLDKADSLHGYLTIFLDNNSILKIHGSKTTWPNVKMVGSTPTTDYYNFLAFYNIRKRKIDSLIKQRIEIYKVFAQSEKDSETKTKDSLSDLMGKLDKRIDVAEDNLHESWFNYISNYPMSLYTPESIIKLASYLGPIRLQTAYDKLTPKVKASFYGIELKKKIAIEKVRLSIAVGNKAPDFNSVSNQGDTVIFSKIVSSGKLTLLDFWASWCKPCRKENPYMKILYEKYHSLGLNVVYFSIDQDAIAWKKAIEVDKIPWFNISDLKGVSASEVAQSYGVYKAPTTFLLDSNGTIVAIDIRGEDLENALKSTLLSAKN